MSPVEQTGDGGNRDVGDPMSQPGLTGRTELCKPDRHPRSNPHGASTRPDGPHTTIESPPKGGARWAAFSFHDAIC